MRRRREPGLKSQTRSLVHLVPRFSVNFTHCMSGPTMDEVAAATKVQALHRGRKVRINRKEQTRAAKTIQRLHRKKFRSSQTTSAKMHCSKGPNKSNIENEHNAASNDAASGKCGHAKESAKERPPSEVLASLHNTNILESPRVPAWLMKDAETHRKSMIKFTNSSKRTFLKSLRRKNKPPHRFPRFNTDEESSKTFWNAVWPQLEQRGWQRNKHGNFVPPRNKKDLERKEKVENKMKGKISVVAKRSKNQFLKVKYRGLSTSHGRIIHAVDWVVAVPLKKRSVLRDVSSQRKAENTTTNDFNSDNSYKLRCEAYLYNELDGILMVRFNSGRTSHLSIGLDDFILVSTKIGQKKDVVYRRLRRRLRGVEKLRHDSAAKIQSIFRFFNIRSQTEPKLKEMRLKRRRLRSTIKIQSAYKGYLTRKSFKKELDKLRTERERRRQLRVAEQKKGPQGVSDTMQRQKSKLEQEVIGSEHYTNHSRRKR